MEGARIGAECNIGEHCFVESGAVVGNRVTVKNGVQVWNGVTLEDDVFLGPNAVLTNDVRPRSRSVDFKVVPTLLQRGCSIGANATVLCGLTIGRYSLVGAGSVVTRDVPDFGLVVGSPARLRGHVCVCANTLDFGSGESARCGCGREYGRSGERIESLS
jgi:acetyltransferase-like isoleucine patch superfamily enzyme